MSQGVKELVFSRNVVEFAAVAKEFCAFIESATTFKRSKFCRVASSLLPLLYYKTTLLPDTEPVYDDGNPKHVTEEYYMALSQRLKKYMGEFDAFPEVFDRRISETDEGFSANISEYLCDIYQDLKDFTMVYQKGFVEEMNDALWECTLNFRDFWGIRLANVIRAFHLLTFADSDIDLDAVDPDTTSKDSNADGELDTNEWFITRRQNEKEEDY